MPTPPAKQRNIPEIVIHYLWQHCLWAGFPQTTTYGEQVNILSVGRHNLNAGPDFLNAHICIGQREWVGNIEIHINSSDWYRHRHHTDPAYDTVILHIVRNADKKIYNSKGNEIEQCVLQYPTNQDYLTELIQSAQRMDSAASVVECSKRLLSDPILLTQGWRKALLHNRLECKRQAISDLLTITKGSWEHAFYITLAHNFGFHTNGIPFELLAIQTPLSCLQKHRNSLFQLTAILFGQSGLLSRETATTEDDKALLREYLFLQKKFSLTPVDASIWKHARMRPQSFPEVRIRQFAQLIYQAEFLFSNLMDAATINDCVRLFTLSAGTKLGKASIHILLINTVLPYKYTFALANNNLLMEQQVYTLLQQIPPEDNHIIRQWKLLGQSIQSAADTQSLIHLYQNYCQPHNCINCDVGYRIFQNQTFIQ